MKQIKLVPIIILLLITRMNLVAQENPPAGEAGTEKNIFFLDRGKGEPAELIKGLEATADKSDEILTKLGWLYYLYENNPVKAREYFQKALDKNPKNLSALDGLGDTYYWEGNREKSGAAALEYLKAAPDDPLSEMTLRLLDSNYYYIRLPFSQRIELFNQLLAKPLANKINEYLIKKELSAYRRDVYGARDETAWQIWKSMGYPDKWLVIGYFGTNGDIAFDEVFPPEKAVKPSKKYPVQDWEITYHKRVISITNYTDCDYLTKPLRNHGNTIYLVTYIKSPAERPMAVRLNDARLCKVWINNQLVGEVNHYRAYVPRETAIGAYLTAGWNKLLIKLVSDSPGEIRITSPEGGAYPDLTYEIEFPDNKLPAVKPAPADLPPVVCFMGASDTLRERVKDPAHKTVSDYSALGYLCNLLGLPQEGFRLYEEFYNYYQELPGANLMMAYAYQKNDYLPQEKRLNQARAAAEHAREISPQYIPALEYLANYYESKDKDKALGYLKEMVKLQPDNVDVHRVLANHYQQRNWPAEYYKELETMNKLAPESPMVWSQWNEYYEALGNHQKAYEYSLRRQKYYGGKYDWSTIDHRLQMGDYEYVIGEYLKLITEYPEESDYYNYLGYLYRLRHKYDEAEKYYLKEMELEPEKDYECYDDLADFYWEWGKEDKAKEYWAKLLALPMKYGVHNDNTRQFMEFLSGEKTDWTGYEVKAEEIIKNAPGEKEYPKVSTIILLEQHLTRLIPHPVESALTAKEESVHQIVKIMNKKGGEHYGDMYNQGRVEEMRVFLPDGRILEPEPIQDGGVRLPELDKGSIIEIKYTNRSGYSYHPPDEVQEFFSTDEFRRAKEPILHLRYALIIPDSLSTTVLAGLRQKNLGELKPITRANESTLTYIWEAKNLADYDPEQWMPEGHELFTWIEAYQGKFSMERFNQETLSQYLEEKVPDNVRAKAEELTAGLTTRLEKVRALYQFCVSEIKGDEGGSGGHRSDTSLSQTLIEKQGSIAPLFMAFLESSEIEAYWALARASWRPGEDVEKNGPGFSDSGLIYLPPLSDEKAPELWLAPQQFQPFGLIPPDIQGGQAYIILKNGGRIVDLPRQPLEHNCVGALNAEIDISPEGVTTVDGEMTFGGTVGAGFRRQLKEYATEQQKRLIMEQIAGQLFKGAQLKSSEIPDFQLDEPVMRLKFQCMAPQFLSKTKKGWRFKPIVRPLELTENFLRETERKFPLRLSYIVNALNNIDRMTINLPEGAKITLPANVVLWTEFGSYSRTIIQRHNSLEFERRFILKSGDISVEAYPRFVDFCKKIEASEKDWVSFTRPKEPTRGVEED